MAKVIVTKCSYYILQSIFYTFILSGLIWQVTQISVNFFKFEIVSDIKIMMPEKENLTKYFNLCFENYKVIDYDRYEKYCKSRHMTPNESNFNDETPVKDRFNLTQHRGPYFTYDVIRYFRSSFICYHGNITGSEAVLYKSQLPNVTAIGLFFSQVYPVIDFERLQFFSGTNQMTKSSVKILHSNVYTMKRLKFPYPDACIKHEYSKVISHAECLNEKTMTISGKLSRASNIAENEDINFSNMTIISSPKKIHDMKCNEILLYPDCHENSIFTYFKPGLALVDTNETKLVLKGSESLLPSFLIESKPRIDNIDYVTYIFGALGTWVGFCFLQLNPIGIFFQRQDIAVSRHDTNNLAVTRNRMIMFEIAAKLRYSKYDHDIGESKQDIVTLKRKLNEIIHYLNQSQK